MGFMVGEYSHYRLDFLVCEYDITAPVIPLI